MGLLYERFSHGVISVFMLSFGLYPLVLGSLVDGWLLWRGIDQVNPWSDRLRLWSICTLCTGSFLQGVLEIYGTQSDLLRLYWVTGGLLLAAALVCGVKKR
ncbi:hypothetical protein HCH52_05810 [Oscillospiraceae bacterium HV4-5-C5C]|nr:hypothetical protein [Oscillospiraceae bacterium HV4-5-C5C]